MKAPCPSRKHHSVYGATTLRPVSSSVVACREPFHLSCAEARSRRGKFSPDGKQLDSTRFAGKSSQDEGRTHDESNRDRSTPPIERNRHPTCRKGRHLGH